MVAKTIAAEMGDDSKRALVENKGSGEVLVKCKGVTKKFCRSLSKSLSYGVRDIIGEFLGSRPSRDLRNGEFYALNGVDLELRRGECLGLIGPNGAGKSTLLKMINGLIKPDAGTITVRGRVGALIELGAGFNPILTGRENIYVNASILGMTKKEVDSKLEEIIEFSEVGDAIDAPVQTYSSGMKVRLGFAITTVLDPDVLLIDEVLAVGDVAFRMKCYQHLQKLMENGTSIIFVSHQIYSIFRICDRVAVLGSGEVQYDGATSGGIPVYEELTTEKLRLAKGSNQFKGVEIKDLKFTPGNGEEMESFTTGNSLDISFQLSCEKAEQKVRFLIRVESDQVGFLSSFGSYEKLGYLESLSSGQTFSVSMKFPKIDLLVGSYVIDVMAFSEEHDDVLASLPAAGRLRVVRPEINVQGFGMCGVIAFENKWKVEELK